MKLQKIGFLTFPTVAGVCSKGALGIKLDAADKIDAEVKYGL